MTTELNRMGDEAYEAWLLDLTNGAGNGTPTDDESLVTLFSSVLREKTAEGRAQGLVDVANMCLAMADRTLGCQVSVAKCLVMNIH